MSLTRLHIATLILLVVAATPAAAQGNGNAYGHGKNPRPPSTSRGGPSAAGSAGISVPGTGVRNFGAWLDDASTMTPGDGSVSIGLGLWNMPGYREFDLPTFDAGVGLHPRLQIGASVPYYHANEPGGPVARGVGTMYLSAKVQLRDPSTQRVGISVTPALEVLGAAPLAGSRVSWARPVNFEVQGSGWRTYGSAGYFSRRAVFASGAFEKRLGQRTSATGTVTHAYSMDPDPLSFSLGLEKVRTDVSGGLAYGLSDAMTAFGSIGRTISTRDANSTNLVLAGGLAFSFQVR